MPYRMDPQFSKRILDACYRVVLEVYPQHTITGNSISFATSDAAKFLIDCCEEYYLCQVECGDIPFEVAFGDEEIKSRLEDMKHLLSLDGKFCHYYCAQIIWSAMGGEKYAISKFNYKEKFPNHEDCLDIIKQLVASTDDYGVSVMLSKANLLTHAIYDFNQLLRYHNDTVKMKAEYLKAHLRWGIADKVVG